MSLKNYQVCSYGSLMAYFKPFLSVAREPFPRDGGDLSERFFGKEHGEVCSLAVAAGEGRGWLVPDARMEEGLVDACCRMGEGLVGACYWMEVGFQDVQDGGGAD